MKRRVASAALFGLGLLCLVVAAALAWLIVPAQSQYPFDTQPPDVVVAASDATFVQAKTLDNGDVRVGVEHGGLTSRTGIKPDYEAAAKLAGDLAGITLIWNVYQATDRADNGEPINRAETRIALDRKSGAAVPWNGQCYNDAKEDKTADVGCIPGNISFSGQLYLFPFGTQKQTYQYWDSTLERALPMAYETEEKYNGLPTYRFHQEILQQNLETDSGTMAGLLGALARGAHNGTMTYRASRTLWVEPHTGAIIGYQEAQHREVVPDVGARVVIFDASFQYDEPTKEAVRKAAADGRNLLLLLGVYLPIGLAVLGLVLLVAGILLARRGPKVDRHVAAHAAEPEPTAVPQA